MKQRQVYLSMQKSKPNSDEKNQQTSEKVNYPQCKEFNQHNEANIKAFPGKPLGFLYLHSQKLEDKAVINKADINGASMKQKGLKITDNPNNCEEWDQGTSTQMDIKEETDAEIINKKNDN